jgi:outer membrane lipoprotein-sorting protein
MRFLRHISTHRLLALCAALVGVAAAGTAIALAAGSGGPTPPPKPLAQAVHDAVTAPTPAGITARIHFTNHLIDQSSLGEGADPLLTGADGRLWASPDGKLRVELQAGAQSAGGDSQVLVDGNRFTVYDAGQRTVYTGDLPQDKADQGAADQPPSLADIQAKIAEVMKRATLSDAQPSDVAGRAAYTVRVSPKHDGGLLGGAELAWDAANGVPLRAAVYAAGSSDPVLQLEATDISFGKVDPSVFDVKPPADAKVVDLAPKSGPEGPDAKPVEGVDAVQAKLPFKLTAPDTLVGLPRSTVRLISSDEHPAALVTYGRNLGGLAIIETEASGNGAVPKKDERGGLSLPTVKIGSVTGTELDTALGTAITFDRDGVTYVVLGSVPPAAAEAAANAL